MAAAATLPAHDACAWGDEGHRVIALIARQQLSSQVGAKVDAMLAADSDTLTDHDIASEATWADRLRDNPKYRLATRQWHFVDIEVDSPDVKAACFGEPKINSGNTAFDGPADDCVVDKIDEFKAEVTNPGTAADERLIALKFLLHFVGDLHQPLHSADEHDRGGNDKRVSATGIKAGNLHHYWDTEFVVALGDESEVVDSLATAITPEQAKLWQTGTTSDWAMETFQVAKKDAYNLPEASTRHSYRLSDDYVTTAEQDVSAQLSKAGTRLAYILNTALDVTKKPPTSCP